MSNSVEIEMEAYIAGREAYAEDMRRSKNPYNNDDEWNLNRAWIEGYTDALWND